METTEKFTGKAEVYLKSRPGYPDEYIQYLLHKTSLSGGDTVADIGAGTGILTRQLLDKGLSVMAVEPNDDMRNTAAQTLLPHPRLTLMKGSAEETTLPDHSADLVTAAQAFHWFDVERFRLECRRILKPNKSVALVWNYRDINSPLHQENKEICRKYCPLFQGFNGGMGMGESMDRFERFFRDGRFEKRTFPYPITTDLEGFLGRNLSSSYSLKPSDAAYPEFMEVLTQLFDRYRDGQQITLPNITCSYIGEV